MRIQFKFDDFGQLGQFDVMRQLGSIADSEIVHVALRVVDVIYNVEVASNGAERLTSDV